MSKQPKPAQSFSGFDQLNVLKSSMGVTSDDSTQPDESGEDVIEPVGDNRSEGPNLGWLYYRDYFRAIDIGKPEDKAATQKKNTKTIKKNNDKLLEQPLPANVATVPARPDATFLLQTTYPGLVTGVGVKHETGRADSEFKLGFAFDHTTGLPYIAGSGVKGKLRSFFAHKKYLCYVLNTVLTNQLNVKRTFSETDIAELEKDIFVGTGKAPYKRDVFHDAFAVQANGIGVQLLADDAITNHPHPLKNPNPVQFLKVGPGVTFRFAFRLFPHKLTLTFTVADKRTLFLNTPRKWAKPKLSLFTASDKCKLFRYLLCEHGIGAKTRVGYGQLIEV